MASICKPPEALSFNGNVAQNWKEFEEQLIWFLEGTESSEKSDMIKIGIMLSHAGKEARDVYKTLPWDTEGDNKKFDKVLAAFRKYCSPRKHILYERYMFWNIRQEETESVDAYLTRIRLKLEMCEYATEVRQDLARDKFVFGLIDNRTKERLLREERLDLSTAVAIAQRAESSGQQIKEMSTTTRTEINIMQRNWGQGNETAYCGNCGCQHKPRQCPAYGQVCSFCHKANHFSRVCHSRLNSAPHKSLQSNPRSNSTTSRKVQEIEQSEAVLNPSVVDSQDLFIDPLQVDGLNKSQSWFANISTSGGQLSCKLDTGAEVSVLPVKIYEKLQPKPTLKQTTMKLTAYGGTSIQPIGTCQMTCTAPDSPDSKTIEFYITPVDAQPILGLTGCVELGLIKRVCPIQELPLTKETLLEKYPTVFTGLGQLGTYHITLHDNHQPVINPPRRIPHSLKAKLQQALERNVRTGVLKKVNQPTDWVSNLVVVEKKDGSLRLCLDPKDLNKAIKREHYKIPTMEEIAAEFTGKTVFSTLDLKDGYWQIQLDEDSSQLCTFNTPFGRYRFTRMPFGIKSASEVFQKRNEETFAGISGIHIVADDIIIAASSIKEHDEILTQIMERAKDCNVVFNLNKLQLRVREVKYLGTIVTPEGTKPDPTKVQAIIEMAPPTDKPGIRRLLGMINFLAPHIPNMSTVTAPLRCLLKSDALFEWKAEQVTALTKVKEILSSTPVLHHFDPKAISTIQADASQSGLGACLLQKGKPIAYASRSLSQAECNYVQIEKELLAVVFACNKFHQYIYGYPTNVQSDHKPLEVIMLKPLHKVSPRLQRMLLKLQKYDLHLHYTKGKELYVADTLSRAYLHVPSTDNDEDDLEFAVHSLVRDLPVSDSRLSELQSATASDVQMQQLHEYITTGWPANISSVPLSLRTFWNLRNDLHAAENLILINNRIVIPAAIPEMYPSRAHGYREIKIPSQSMCVLASHVQ